MSEAPTFWAVARRPRWIAALILVLAIASGFAALGRWQLERSVIANEANTVDTETPVALTSVTEPGVPVNSSAYARMLSVSGSFDPAGYLILHGRLQAGTAGYWVTGRLITDESNPTSLAVALGWAPTLTLAETAQSDAVATLGASDQDLLGRYLPGEEPRFEDALTGERSALSIAALVNVWPDYSGDVYAGYLIVTEPPVAGLEAITAPPPLPEQQVNLLNLFYAIEWVIFAGFAVYLWWRLVKDEVEKEAAALDAGTARTPTVD